MWLEVTNLRLNYPSRKLAPKQQGPFKISQVLSLLTYQLCLLSTWKIHDIFHATLLSSYKETETHGLNFSKPLPDLIGTKEEYEVEQIVSHHGTMGVTDFVPLHDIPYIFLSPDKPPFFSINDFLTAPDRHRDLSTFDPSYTEPRTPL